MPRPSLFGEPANQSIHVRLTESQRRDLDRVAAENGMALTVIIREAVNEYVADYSDRKVFRSTK